MTKIPTRSYTMPEDYDSFEREAPPTIDLNRRTGISEVESSYSEPEAKRQAERCLQCHVQTIYDPGEVRTVQSLRRRLPGVLLTAGSGRPARPRSG